MLQLGPELFQLLNDKQLVGNQTPVVYGKGGLNAAEIAGIERSLGFSLPADFIFLLENVIDEGGVLFPWKNFNKSSYDEMIAWVLQGIEFDIECNNLWLWRWGDLPSDLQAARDVARRDFATWPKLLPLYGHRFVAAEPCETDNPVFSIMQTDIIYYGANLAHYLVNEFIDHKWQHHTHDQSPRHIPIWSDFAEDNDNLLAWPSGSLSVGVMPWNVDS